MKTASVQQLPQKWVQILEWVAAGEEVELTQQEKVVARVIPATQPDFLARAKSIWGEQPAEVNRDLSGHRLLRQTLLPGSGQSIKKSNGIYEFSHIGSSSD
jgi:antitoxin (DNA-binding transcriptional repressor) of toxin-antitoxin stability system